MIIKSVLLDRKRFKLVDSDFCRKKNVFTVIVGSNGTGKSRLLKRLVNGIKNVEHSANKVPNNYSRQIDFENENYIGSYYSTPSESKSIVSRDKESIDTKYIKNNPKVIAVSTTPFDKFPVDYKGNEMYRYHDDYVYTYIGLKVSKNSLNQSNFMNLLFRSILINEDILKNRKLFELLKLQPVISTCLKPRMRISIFDFIEFEGKYSFLKNKLGDFDAESNFISNLKKKMPTLYEKLKSKRLIKKTYNSVTSTISFIDTPIHFDNPDIPKEDILFLMDIGFLNVSDFYFSDEDGKKIKISELSSGQKCLILTLLNIAGSITDNSVICIDEPEISLHPKWQKEFMKVLIEFFEDYQKCHFIIATHSPLIISELSNDNCYILNMDDGYAKKASEHMKMSSDFQLAEVFGVAGNNNEYLNRIVVSLLSKLSQNATLSKSDIGKIKSLKLFSEQMDSNDPVKYLIELLVSAWDKVKHAQ
ncbi:ATP-binding protein (plasmid) [Vibrio coralliilyticus OCN008]|uniref:AAA family ATPase n=1 Tax=Vibrio coralliilyticus TaxID=190893 RepID=UPI0003915FD4|nr:AAA family ATPase [Vibrio coralliilyticus]ERB64217.1 hypothetical protein N779_16865 [Vibrio coralliilyticus OCN008]QIJ87632.1 ATP-binding protein [Vibrio coralliilyticus OCN008]